MAVEYSGNVSGGTDPLGIGVPDLGKSSYDPLKTIRRGWQEQKQDRLIREEREREDYKQYISDLPTFDEINNKFAKELNSEVLDMADLAYKKSKAGIFSPFVKTESNRPVEQDLLLRKKNIEQKAGLYGKYSGMFKQAEAIATDPKNRDLIDWEVTNKRFNDVRNAKSMKEWANVIQDNPVAFKPTQVDMIKEVGDRLKVMLPDDDKNTQIYIDDVSGKLIIKTTEGVGTDRAAKAMRKIYRDLKTKDVYGNQIARDYASAPTHEKQSEDGIPSSEEDWFVSRHVPEYGERITKKTTSLGTGGGSGSKSRDNTPIKSYKTKEGSEVYDFGTNPLKYTGETAEVFNDEGEKEAVKVDGGKITKVGYGKLPDGSYGKYVEIVVTEKQYEGGFSTGVETKTYKAPYDRYSDIVNRDRNLVGINKFGKNIDVDAPKEIPYNEDQKKFLENL